MGLYFKIANTSGYDLNFKLTDAYDAVTLSTLTKLAEPNCQIVME